MTVLLSLASVVAVSLASLVGLLTLSANPARVRRLAALLVAFAVGALLGDAFIHLIPESFARSPRSTMLGPSLLILGGLLAFFVIEKLVRHGHGPSHGRQRGGDPTHDGSRPALAAINIIGDGVHNFIDGVLIGASYLASPTLGLSTTLAVLLHEVPQELGDFGILVHSGLTVRRAVLWNLASASVAILGTAAALVVGTVAKGALTGVLLPLTAGGFVYLAAAALIPELQRDRSLRGLVVQTGLIVAGIGVMGLLTLLDT